MYIGIGERELTEILTELGKVRSEQVAFAKAAKDKESLSLDKFLSSHETMIKLHGDMTRMSVLPVAGAVRAGYLNANQVCDVKQDAGCKDTPLERLSRVEKAIMGDVIGNSSLIQRVNTLEDAVFGTRKTGALTTRVTNVLEAAEAFL